MNYIRKNWLVLVSITVVAVGTLALVIGLSSTNSGNQASAHVLNSPTVVTTLSPVAVAKPVVLTPAEKVAKQISCTGTKDEAGSIKQMGEAASMITDIATCSMNGTKYAVLTFTGSDTKSIVTLGLSGNGIDPVYQGPTWLVISKAQVDAAS